MADIKFEKIFKTIGARIKERRKFLKMTQAQVCEILECDKRYFQKIEAGQASITVLTLQKISNALQISVDALVRTDNDGSLPEGAPKMGRSNGSDSDDNNF